MGAFLDVIQKALAKGRTALSEHESKRFLANFGIPVIRETLARDAESAVVKAEKIGFPVVLKASGPDLFHKTEVGGIALNLRNKTEVRAESRRLLKIKRCKALLVQEMVKGDRELVCGLTRDDHFGPCVMFGLGGIFTEVFEDVVLRLAPLTPWDAREMIREIRSTKIIDPFRGQAAVDIDLLSQILVGLGQIGMEYEDVQEIDINPLKIRPDGNPVAVDALVVLKRAADTRRQRPRRTSTVKEELTPFFEPASVAIIGASSTPGKPGHEVIRNILANGYPGKLHLVNPKGGDLLGLPVHPSISSLPEGIDLGIIILPAKDTPQALRECAAKKIKHFVLSAGGFAEVDEYGAQIQQEILDIVREKKIRVIGPNTSGHTSTPHPFTSTFFPLGKIRRGKVSYVAQTGNFATHSMKLILTGEHFGVSRVIGLGNKIDIEESEALQYLAGDPDTSAIIMYLESIKYPRHFLEVAREVTRHKPVVLLKGGATEAGRHAAVAHTAAMAAEDRIVDGLLRQAGVVRLWDYTDLIHVGKAFSMVSLPEGNRVSFLAPSGAMLVCLSDLCTRLDLEVPEFEAETLRKLEEISPPFIRMRNPVDIWAAASRGIEFGYREGLEAVLKDKHIDAVIVILMLAKEIGVPSYNFIVDLSKRFPEKPVFVTFSGDKKYIDECRNFLEPQGIPTFLEIEEPFKVLSILARCTRAMNRSASFPHGHSSN
jgi:acyl-CoA synthetase (NDP forming)